jgi:hypothetical protein
MQYRTRAWSAIVLALVPVLVAGSVIAQSAPTPSKRRTRPGDPGTIEAAIAAYHGTTRPVDEGTLPGLVSTGTCPPEMVKVDDRFCVDKWEGTIVEVHADGTTAPHAANEALEDGKKYLAKSVPGVIPQAYISAEQAQAACTAAGKRLCNPTEWRLACGGTNAWVYPYGTTRVHGRCNDDGKNPMLFYHPPPTVKRGWPGWNLEELNDPRNDALEGTVAKTGAFAGCVNDWGAFDMVGNLHEWTSDPNGTFQGGYFLDTLVNGEGCAYRTTAHHYRYHDYSTGFRCCAAPK